MVVVVEERHASRPESLSSICCISTSNPSSFFKMSSMDVVMRLSNLEALRDARAAADAFPPN